MDMPPPEQPPDAAGSVIVDIGGDAGAAVISTPSELVGSEIEIRAVGTEWDGTHTGVHERQGPGITTTAHPAPVVIVPAQITWVTWAGVTPARSEA